MTTEEMNNLWGICREASWLQDCIRNWRDILDDVTQYKETLFVAYRHGEGRAQYKEIVGLAENEVIRNYVIAEIQRRIDDAQKKFDELALPRVPIAGTQTKKDRGVEP